MFTSDNTFLHTDSIKEDELVKVYTLTLPYKDVSEILIVVLYASMIF